jgi:hypothetical protein
LAVNNDGANEMQASLSENKLGFVPEKKRAFLPENKLAFYIDEAQQAGAGSRSEIYEALREGALKAKKRGRRTVILRDDLADYLASLPDYRSAA